MAQQRLQQEQKLQQKLSPQQIQLMRLLELNEPEMEERVKQELVENPALEEGIDTSGEDNYNASEGNLDEDGYPTESAEQLSLGDYYSEDDIPDYRFGTHNYSPDDNHEQAPIGAGSSFHEFLLRSLLSLQHGRSCAQSRRWCAVSSKSGGCLHSLSCGGSV